MSRRLFASALLICAWVMSARGAAPHNSGYGFSFQVPDGWVQVPQREVDGAAQRLFKGSPPDKLFILSAFQPRDQRWFGYPYVMVQLIRYPDGKAPTESEMRAMVRQFTKPGMSKTLVGATRDVQEVAKTARVSEGYFDPFTRKYDLPMEMTAPGVGKVKGKIVGHFGKHHLIQLCCYDREDRFISSEAQFGKILDSFKWDEYSNIPESKLGDKGTIIALGAGAAVVLLIMLLNGGRKTEGVVIAPRARARSAASDAPWR